MSKPLLQNLLSILAGLVFTIALGGGAMAQEATGLPALNMVTQPDGSTTYSLSLQILALMTAVSLLPSLVLGMTSFTRIIIVLSILRQAMGTQQTPPNQVLIAIALFLSLFIMTPTLTAVYDEAVNPMSTRKLRGRGYVDRQYDYEILHDPQYPRKGFGNVFGDGRARQFRRQCRRADDNCVAGFYHIGA